MKKEFNLSEKIWKTDEANLDTKQLVYGSIDVLKVQDVKEFIKRLKEGIGLIYGINLENAIKSGVSEKLRKEVLELIKGCGKETKNIIDKLAGKKLK